MESPDFIAELSPEFESTPLKKQESKEESVSEQGAVKSPLKTLEKVSQFNFVNFPHKALELKEKSEPDALNEHTFGEACKQERKAALGPGDATAPSTTRHISSKTVEGWE